MLKFVIIGVLIVGFIGFVLWNLWKMTLLKHKYFSESETFLQLLDQFKDAPAKLKRIKADKIKIWVVAAVGSLLAVLVALAYFLIARNVFVNNHAHSYKDRVTAKPTCITAVSYTHLDVYKCQSLLRLHETIQTLKQQTADAYILNRKVAAYTKTVTRFCEDVARELFYKDRYWDYMPEDLDEVKIPQLNYYKQLKSDLQSLITQRKNLEDLYGKQYENYLLNASAQGKIMFGYEGYSEYGNN